MALTTTSFISNLTSMSVTGVVRAYTYMPGRINQTDCPAMFPRLPESGNAAITFGSTEGLDTIQVEMVILTQTTETEMNSTKYSELLTQVDNLVAALKTEAAANNEIDNWAITTELMDTGSATYWSIVATITGSN